jgi:hypothetical protein
MIIDVGASVSPAMRDQTLRQTLSDLYEVVHDFSTDRDDLRVSFICEIFYIFIVINASSIYWRSKY